MHVSVEDEFRPPGRIPPKVLKSTQVPSTPPPSTVHLPRPTSPYTPLLWAGHIVGGQWRGGGGCREERLLLLLLLLYRAECLYSQG